MNLALATEVNSQTKNISFIIQNIIKLQKSHEIAQDLLSQSFTESSTGFLISSYQENDFTSFLQQEGNIYITYDQKENVLAYLLANRGPVFLANHPKTKIEWLSNEIEKKYGSDYLEGNFTYLDQVGVDKGMQRKKFAYQLHTEFFKNAKGHFVMTAVLREPLFNRPSHEFFRKNGYLPVADFFTPQLKGLLNVRSTVFLKEIQ